MNQLFKNTLQWLEYFDISLNKIQTKVNNVWVMKQSIDSLQKCILQTDIIF